MTIHTDHPTTALDRRAPDSGERFPESIPRAAVQRVLDNDRRREVLRCLLAEDGPLEVRTLVARIADAETDATSVTPLLERRQRVHVSLCRTHLPLLEDHRILSYDRVRGLVSPGATLSAFESLLDVGALERPVGARLD
ncbi:hypothetical protein GS429_02310 [Natronorubrum sp. JWXQ-INN-674]|uniref:DUF7344 domain-containing protein n=1 Tax=Natronorubrum halalkaliphilum TaxID=2691917 RepID=A0A6B0VHF9_9EURY|nr:hypothetical protein [Natronorubrum halalkaliphilum]MXV60924.1 hypothetical protein [Natronorubrum halalkaliphilum]